MKTKYMNLAIKAFFSLLATKRFKNHFFNFKIWQNFSSKKKVGVGPLLNGHK